MFCLCLSESSMTNSSEVETLAIQPHKLLILDARSYAAAVANRAKGGGCECPGTRRIRSMCAVDSGAQKLIMNAIVLRHYFHQCFCSRSRVLSQLRGGIHGNGQHSLHTQEFPVATFPLHSDAWSSQVCISMYLQISLVIILQQC